MSAPAQVTFRDPPPVDGEAAALRLRIAATLARAPALPVALGAPGLFLLDVLADRQGISLVIGAQAPLVLLRLTRPLAGALPVVTLEPTGPGPGRFEPLLLAMAKRLGEAVTAERWAQAWEAAQALGKLPTGIPLQFFRQLVAGVEPAQGQVRVGFGCNQDCGMCWQGRSWGRFGPEQLLRWIEDLAAAGVRRLLISGGEPTLDAELPRYLQASRAAGFEAITLETNAVLLGKPGAAARLREAGLTDAFVSLHGADAATSDAITRAPGTHERTVRGIASLLDAGLPVKLNAVMTAEGIDRLPALPGFIAERFGAHPGLQGLMLSAPTPPFDRALTAAVLPHPERVRAALLATIDAALEAGVVLHGLDGPCGPPLCAFGADPRLLSGGEVPGPLPFRRYLPACEACRVRPYCFGVRDEDHQLYGDACATPL